MHFLFVVSATLCLLCLFLHCVIVVVLLHGNSDLVELISLFSELRCGTYLFLSGFYCWKFKQITKIEFGRKNQLSPQCVHTWANSTSYTNISGVINS